MSTASEVAAAIRHAVEHDLRVAMPARVESYDAQKQSVSLQPMLRDYFEADDGELVWMRLPVLSNVPVAFPSAGGIFLTLPIQAGDVGLVICTDRSLEKWLSVGGEVEPEDTRTHNLSDGVFYPGLSSFAHPRQGVSATAAALQVENGLGVFVKAAKVGLGEENPSWSVALAEKVLDRLNAMKATFDGHTHAVTGTVTSGGALTGTANAPSAMAAPASVGSTTVKVKD